MLEVTEMILASISAKKKMTREEIDSLPYLKNISEYGIELSLHRLFVDGYIYESAYSETYKISKLGDEYLREHDYLE